MTRAFRPLTLAITLLALWAGAAGAQTSLDWDPRGAELSRQELEELLGRLETAASSPGYSSRLRAAAAAEASVVRARLEEGDYQIGDRVVLWVKNEPAMSDTLSVEPGRVLDIPTIGEISLAGVLRSELAGHLTEQLSRYVRDPEIQASSLVRIAVLGQVGRQGFYTMPASVLVEEALMLAGGPGQRANLDEARVLRGDRVIWGGDALQEAIIEGRTLDQLSLRAGDRIMVPERRAGFFEGGILRTLLITLPPVVYALTRIF